MLELDEADDDRELTLPLGQHFAIRLRENPTTGFRWAVEVSGEPVCRLVTDTFEPASGTPGRAGSHVWQFQAIQAGTSRIRLTQRRSWETDRPPAHHFTLRLHVPTTPGG